jgi:uncharacterized glyoxalase superfamily protein PhnB
MGNGLHVIPGMRYQDALRMIDWLCSAFGFTKKAVYADDKGVVMHAELTLGDGMVMIGSTANASSGLDKQPKEIGGFETQISSLIVTDCDAVYATARAAGGEMVVDLKEMEYGGKGFTCRDPEGHLWNVGSYDPWTH